MRSQGTAYRMVQSRLASKIYRKRMDLPRGGDGDTWATLSDRMRATAGSLDTEFLISSRMRARGP